MEGYSRFFLFASHAQLRAESGISHRRDAASGRAFADQADAAINPSRYIRNTRIAPGYPQLCASKVLTIYRRISPASTRAGDIRFCDFPFKRGALKIRAILTLLFSLLQFRTHLHYCWLRIFHT